MKGTTALKTLDAARGPASFTSDQASDDNDTGCVSFDGFALSEVPPVPALMDNAFRNGFVGELAGKMRSDSSASSQTCGAGAAIPP